MNGYVLFKMWGFFRKLRIETHLFYVEQARKRLLSQFDDIEKEADKAIEEWSEKNRHCSHPDQDDSDALDEGAAFYHLLSEMQNRTRLSVVAGMHHEWDKQLREWMIKEINHWHHGDELEAKIWSVDFGRLADLFESLGWKVRGTKYFNELDACRLVVNVYKHGEGNSLKDLKKNYPEYLNHPYSDFGYSFSDQEAIHHTHLSVSDEQFQAFSNAIVAFWNDVPEDINEREDTSIPDWFGKAMISDQKASNRGQ